MVEAESPASTTALRSYLCFFDTMMLAGKQMKKGYIFAGGAWLTALALGMTLTDLFQEPRFQGQFLDDGVIILWVLVFSILLLLFLAIKLNRSRPGPGRIIVRICFIILVLFAALGIFSIGIYIIPAAIFLHLALSKSSLQAD